MSVPAVKFNVKDRPEFFRELRKRVNLHFKENNKSKNADYRMVFKTVFMLVLYFTPLALMLTGIVSTFGLSILMWTVMGFGMAGIGLAVMHDANHGSYSSNATVNRALGWLINTIGGYHVNWKIQHNVLHHSYTNVHEHDEDINKPVMRFSPNQERKGIYKYQLFYAPFLYGFMTIYWLLVKDFEQAIRYHKRNLLEGQGVNLTWALAGVVFNKAWYFVLFLVLPIMYIALPLGQILLGFFLMHFVCGLILALIFQPAHVLEETEFFITDEYGSVENNWAIHQLRTTSNFANENRLLSWYVGGLNFQIEHHLFPQICHIHYRSISPIVREVAAEFNVPYNEHKTFYGAVKSHFTHLHQLGTGEYDRKLAEAAATV